MTPGEMKVFGCFSGVEWSTKYYSVIIFSCFLTLLCPNFYTDLIPYIFIFIYFFQFQNKSIYLTDYKELNTELRGWKQSIDPFVQVLI